jgi:hypothetical protein
MVSTIPLMLLVFFTYQARLKKPKNYKLETQNTNKSKKTQWEKPKLQDTKSKKPMEKHDRCTKNGKSKEQDMKTHNIGCTKDRIQQQTKLKPHRKEKNINNKLHNKH